jgi:hypothetical protein
MVRRHEITDRRDHVINCRHFGRHAPRGDHDERAIVIA